MVPEVGYIIAKVAQSIEDLQIEQTIRNVAEEINSVIKKAQDGVLKEVKNAASGVAGKLEGLTEKIPGWTDTITFMSHISRLIDIMVYVTPESKDLKDEVIQKAVDVLNQTFGGILTNMKYIKLRIQYSSVMYICRI
ncbi:hypothetical protein AA313_de0209060 [Arthrobotrys entomopaga]|nr:hypothetical protein AA313_de0209060 [Arthrobotrys entomopaga]